MNERVESNDHYRCHLSHVRKADKPAQKLVESCLERIHQRERYNIEGSKTLFTVKCNYGKRGKKRAIISLVFIAAAIRRDNYEQGMAVAIASVNFFVSVISGLLGRAHAQGPGEGGDFSIPFISSQHDAGG